MTWVAIAFTAVVATIALIGIIIELIGCVLDVLRDFR